MYCKADGVARRTVMQDGECCNMYCKADGVARWTVMQDGCRELQHVGGRGVLQGGQGVLQGMDRKG